MDSGIRCRTYATDAQVKTLAQWIGCQRFIQNAKVEESHYFLRNRFRPLALTRLPVPHDQSDAQFKRQELTPLAI